MFDIDDFVVCIECLLLGPEKAQERWETANAAVTTTTKSTVLPLWTWRTAVTTTDDTSWGGNNANNTDNTKSTKDSTVVHFVDIIFQYTFDTEKKILRPTVKMGALFSRSGDEQGGSSDGSSVIHNDVKAYSYALSDELSAKDIADHYASIGAELDDYSEKQSLNLAIMFVNALRNFSPVSVNGGDGDKVVLFYKEFDAALDVVLPNASRQELSQEFVRAALFGLTHDPKPQVDDIPINDDTTENIDAFRHLVKSARQKDSPVKIKSPASLHSPSKPAKAKASKPKYKVKAVQQKRPKAKKLLPT